MFRTHLVMLPLLATFATAQVDRQLVYSERGLFAEAYGLTLSGQGVMTSSLTLTANAPDGPLLGCVVPDPSYNLTLLYASAETRLPLLPIGIDGHLLVDAVFAAVPIAATSSVQLPLHSAAVWGNSFYLQAIAHQIDPSSGQVDFSVTHGLMLSYYRP